MKWTKSNSLPVEPLVILSYGGWGMGHCKPTKYTSCPAAGGDGYNCWQACYSNPQNTAQELVNYAKGNGFDGMELDYELIWHINQTECDFLVRTLAAARKLWPEGVISISSMEWPLEDTTSPGNYLQMLANATASLDFASVTARPCLKEVR